MRSASERNRYDLRPLLIILSILACIRCAGPSNHYDPYLSYECNNLKYKMTYKDGLIDTSFIYTFGDSLVEASVWESASLNDVFNSANAPGMSKHCRDLQTSRRQTLRMILRREKRPEEKAYGQELARQPHFEGEMWFLFYVNQAGRTERIYVLKNGISNQDYARDMVSRLSKARFESDDSCGTQELTYSLRLVDVAL